MKHWSTAHKTIQGSITMLNQTELATLIWLHWQLRPASRGAAVWFLWLIKQQQLQVQPLETNTTYTYQLPYCCSRVETPYRTVGIYTQTHSPACRTSANTPVLPQGTSFINNWWLRQPRLWLTYKHEYACSQTHEGWRAPPSNVKVNKFSQHRRVIASNDTQHYWLVFYLQWDLTLCVRWYRCKTHLLKYWISENTS